MCRTCSSRATVPKCIKLWKYWIKLNKEGTFHILLCKQVTGNQLIGICCWSCWPWSLACLALIGNCWEVSSLLPICCFTPVWFFQQQLIAYALVVYRNLVARLLDNSDSGGILLDNEDVIWNSHCSIKTLPPKNKGRLTKHATILRETTLNKRVYYLVYYATCLQVWDNLLPRWDKLCKCGYVFACGKWTYSSVANYLPVGHVVKC